MPHSERDPGLHVLPVHAQVLSGFLPLSKDMHVRLIGDSKSTVGLHVSMRGCLSHLSLCGPVMDWRPVRGVPQLSPGGGLNELQPPTTLNWIKRV